MNTKPQCINVPQRRCLRRGVSMLELVIAGSMMAVIMTSLSVVMRTSRQAWDAGEGDYSKLHQGHSVVRHFVRAAREAKAVDSIAAGGSEIVLRDVDGTTRRWTWDVVGSGTMQGTVTTRTSTDKTDAILAYDINQLRFVGYKADGKTVTTTPGDIHLVEVTAEVTLPRGHQSQRRIVSKVWIRSW